MIRRMEDIINGKAANLIWFLEHDNVYTAGVSTKAEDSEVAKENKADIINISRGGRMTFHAPGQRVVYLMIDLNVIHHGSPDVRKYVRQLEEIIISTLGDFNIAAKRVEGMVGVWVDVVHNGIAKIEKIAAIGVKFRKGCTMHGFAINIDIDLKGFKKIIPCGINNFDVCSLQSIGRADITMSKLDARLEFHINRVLFEV